MITAFNQGELIAEAVRSVRAQTRPPVRVVVVDDGSTELASLAVLDELESTRQCEVIGQSNHGVSAARNTGLASVEEDLVVVLDGDDRLAPTFIARTASLVESDPNVLAASSWLRTHGVLEAVVRPPGGAVSDFLHRNACPATVLVRRRAWLACGGYDEGMRDGFEDWDFFVSLLSDGGRIEIVPAALVEYRTTPGSSNVRSMDRRVELYGHLIDKHPRVFADHLRTTLLAHEARAIDAQARWEKLISQHLQEPLGEVTYGDGGMAAAVRIAGMRQ